MRYVLLIGAFLMVLATAPASAGVVARIDLSSQRMYVSVNGKPRYTWKVSTARRGYRTPRGTYRPYLLKRRHYSTIYHGSPMPYSIFFRRGYAIHGSYQTRQLGRRASHGCVRLHPSNAARLFSLVRKYGHRNTRIVITR